MLGYSVLACVKMEEEPISLYKLDISLSFFT